MREMCLELRESAILEDALNRLTTVADEEATAIKISNSGTNFRPRIESPMGRMDTMTDYDPRIIPMILSISLMFTSPSPLTSARDNTSSATSLPKMMLTTTSTSLNMSSM